MKINILLKFTLRALFAWRSSNVIEILLMHERFIIRHLSESTLTSIQINVY